MLLQHLSLISWKDCLSLFSGGIRRGWRVLHLISWDSICQPIDMAKLFLAFGKQSLMPLGSSTMDFNDRWVTELVRISFLILVSPTLPSIENPFLWTCMLLMKICASQTLIIKNHHYWDVELLRDLYPPKIITKIMTSAILKVASEDYLLGTKQGWCPWKLRIFLRCWMLII